MVTQFAEAWQGKDWSKVSALFSEESALSWFEDDLVFGPEAIIAKLLELPVTIIHQKPFLSYTLIEMHSEGRPLLVKVMTADDKIGLVVIAVKDATIKRTRFTLAYDGSRYQGFQRQPHGGAIQNIIEAALLKLFKRPLSIHAASRTDAGVHARKQVFHVDLPHRPDDVAALLNRMLPDDLYVYEAEAVPQLFHSRYDARKKTYHYRLVHTIDPFLSHRALHHKEVDINRLNTHLEPLVGHHDFGAFTVRNEKTNTWRTLYHAHAFKSGDETIIECVGNGFLRHMVRMIVGHVLFDIDHDAQTVSTMIAQPSRQHRAVMAPAKGLYLNDIEY